MTIADEYFTFQTNVSVDFYQCKEDAKACLTQMGAKSINRNKMAFRRSSVTIPEFLSLATSGYAFCNLFKFDPNREYKSTKGNGYDIKSKPVYQQGRLKGAMKLQFKADQFFEGSQTIFMDIDYTNFINIPEYLGVLTYQPTCVYMSFSDKLVKDGVTSRRFRLVYIFDKILNPEDFLRISKALAVQIIADTGEPMVDNCGERMSQYMNGVYGNPEYYISNCVYSSYDFPDNNTNVITTAIQYNSNQNPASIPKPIIIFDEALMNDMEYLSYETFMHYNSWRFTYCYRTEKEEWIDGLYQLTDESYLQLWWYRDKVKDGEKRRTKLYKRACLRKLIAPCMDHDTALFNLYIDRERFFDNSDGVITIETLADKVRKAFELTPEELKEVCASELKYWEVHRPKFIVNPNVDPARSQAVINEISKRLRYARIDLVYNPNLSLQENLREGIDIPQTTLYRYCHSRGIDTNPNKPMTEVEKRALAKERKDKEIELFRSIYKPTLSLRANQSLLKNKGLALSIDTISRWSEKYLQSVRDILTGIVDPSFHFDVPKFNPLSAKYNIPDTESTGRSDDQESNTDNMRFVGPEFNISFYNWHLPD